MKIKLGVFLIIFISLPIRLICANDIGPIEVLTENFPPYNYSENGKVKGLSTDVMKAIFDELKLDFKPKVLPWARALQMTQKNKNTVIYSIGRNKKREDLFKWGGEISPAKTFVYSKKNPKNKAFIIKSLDSLEEVKAKAAVCHLGTTRDDFRESFFVSKGFEFEKHLERSRTHSLNLGKLLNERFCLWAMVELVANAEGEKMGVKVNDVFNKVFSLTELNKNYYFAFGLGTSTEVVQKFQEALKTIKNNGVFDKLMKKYQVTMN